MFFNKYTCTYLRYVGMYYTIMMVSLYPKGSGIVRYELQNTISCKLRQISFTSQSYRKFEFLRASQKVVGASNLNIDVELLQTEKGSR